MVIKKKGTSEIAANASMVWIVVLNDADSVILAKSNWMGAVGAAQSGQVSSKKKESKYDLLTLSDPYKKINRTRMTRIMRIYTDKYNNIY